MTLACAKSLLCSSSGSRGKAALGGLTSGGLTLSLGDSRGTTGDLRGSSSISSTGDWCAPSGDRSDPSGEEGGVKSSLRFLKGSPCRTGCCCEVWWSSDGYGWLGAEVRMLRFHG